MADEEIVEEEEIEEQPEEEEEEHKDDTFKAPATLEEATERLRKAEAAIVKSKRDPKPKPITKQPEGEVPDWGKKILERDEKAEFAEEHNLTRKQVDAAWRYAGGKPDEETLNSPEVQAMIKALGSKDRVAANTPKGGNAPVFKGKTFAEVATNKDSSKEDKEGAFEATKKKHGVG